MYRIFSVSLNRMCPYHVSPLSLAPSSPYLGRRPCFNLLLPPARGEFRGRPGMTFHPLYLTLFPLEGELGCFAKF